MITKKQKQKSSIPEKLPNEPTSVDTKSFEEAEAVPLTKKERMELSRKKILEWSKARRYEKLKALRDEIRGSTIEEENKLRKKIIELTENELKQLNKDLNVEQRKEIARKFSDKLFDAAYNENFDDVLGDITKETREEKMFFTYLGTYGSLKWLKHINALKQKPLFQKLFKKNPSLEREFDRIAEEGDYEKLSEFILNASPDIKKIHSKEEIQNMLILLSDPGSGYGEALQGIPVIGEYLKKGVKLIEKGKQYMHIGFYKRVAKKLNVKLANVMNISGMTFVELKERDSIFQKYKHLLVELQETTESSEKKKKAERQLKYIHDVHVITKAVKEVRENNSELLRKGIKKNLDKDKDLTDEDKIKILTELSLDSLRVYSFLPVVVYGIEGERANETSIQWIGRTLAHYRRFKRAYKFARGFTYGKMSSYEAALARSQASRVFSRNTIRFRSELKRYKDIDKLMSDKLKSFDKEIDNFATATEGKTTGSLADDIKRHDDFLRQYYVLSNRMSELMTQRAQEVINVGAKLDKEVTGLMKKGVKTIEKSRFTSKELKLLGLTDEAGKIGVERVQRAYTDQLLGLRSLRDTAQTEFARIGGKLETRVMSNFEKTWSGKMDVEDLRKSVLADTGEIKRLQKPGGRLWHFGKKLALPAIAVSMPIIDAMRRDSNVRMRDVAYDIFDALIAFVPVAGTINDFKQAFQGYTTSGRKLSIRERILSGVFGVVGAVSDVAWALGGLGAVMRGGIGALRSGKGLAKGARTGKNLFNTLDVVQDAKQMSWAQKGIRKIYGFFKGMSKSVAVHRYAKSAAKADMMDFYRLQKTLKRAGHLDDYSDFLKGGKKFGQISESSDIYKAMEGYKSLLKQTSHGVDYYNSLRKSYGYVDDVPANFLGARSTMTRFWNKVRKKIFIGKGESAGSLREMSKVVGRYDDLVARRTKLIQKMDVLPASSKSYKKMAKELGGIDNQLTSFLKSETKLFGKAEKLARTSLYMSKAARYLTYGGFAMGGIWLLTGENPVSRKAMSSAYETAKVPVGTAAKGALKVAEISSTGIYKDERPIDMIIRDYKEARIKEKRFAKMLEKLEDSDNKDPDKKKKIEELCANFWNESPHVQSWVYKHKDKLDVRRIMNIAKEKITGAKQRLAQRMRGSRPGNIDLMAGVARGSKSIKNV